MANVAPGEDSKTVWSSESGDLRKQSQTPVNTRPLPPRQQTAYLHRDKSGRGGKVVTLVRNLVLTDEDLKSLAKTLKQACGSGGTVREDAIEIQGEQRERVAEVLRKLGYKVKIAGG